MAHADIMGQLPRVETVLYSLTPQSGIGSYAKNHCEFKRATKQENDCVDDKVQECVFPVRLQLRI